MKITNDQYNRKGGWTHDRESVFYVTGDDGNVWSIQPSSRGGLNIRLNSGSGQIVIVAAVSNEIIIQSEDFQ